MKIKLYSGGHLFLFNEQKDIFNLIDKSFKLSEKVCVFAVAYTAWQSPEFLHYIIKTMDENATKLLNEDTVIDLHVEEQVYSYKSGQKSKKIRDLTIKIFCNNNLEWLGVIEAKRPHKNTNALKLYYDICQYISKYDFKDTRISKKVLGASLTSRRIKPQKLDNYTSITWDDVGKFALNIREKNICADLLYEYLLNHEVITS